MSLRTCFKQHALKDVLVAYPKGHVTRKAPAAATAAPFAATVVIRDVRLFDGEAVIERTSVAIDGEPPRSEGSRVTTR